MKKFIYSALAVLTLGLTIVSCGDDNDDENISYSTTAEQATAGTYNGTFTRTGDSGNTETFNGTITLTAGSTVGVTTITFSCPEAKIEATSVANVWNAKHGFQFLNQISDGNADNGLGAPFAGEIDENGTLVTSFTISQRSGRTLVKHNFVFTGKK